MRRKIPFIHVLLFVLTVISTLVAGAVQKGINPLKEPSRIYEGIPFSAALIIILLSHELSHFFTSKKHHTEATLPYFIPAPTLIGTFGAVIKMKSPILSRRALIDIGASGPVMGFIFSIIASVVGLLHSRVAAVPQGGGIVLGDSLIFYVLSKSVIGTVPAGRELVLNPIAFAGWIGFFVTSLNLLPVGQLDGGHVAYAFLGPLHRFTSALVVAVLAVLGLFFWKGWLIWAALMLVLGLRHPPVYSWERPLDRGRKYMGILSLVIFIVTFTPMPFDVF
ncbi:MAG: site-2 protease family protein [Nitrospiraceae bacterium]|nr:site-2 protease family protein [Nitrospiraceae bacterium]